MEKHISNITVIIGMKQKRAICVFEHLVTQHDVFKLFFIYDI